MVVPLFIIFVREFGRFSLQAKITLGILLTGGFTVAALTFFGLRSASNIITTLTTTYETSVTTRVESAIKDVILTEADQADELFQETKNDLATLVEYRSKIETQKASFVDGGYWNASERIFQKQGKQFGNSSNDLASVYIPNKYTLTEEMLADINTSIYLDFLSAGFLESHSEVVAVYYISRMGYTIYYPNINLAEMVPPDFDPVQQPFFTIANPANNPERLARWTSPYQDPAGTGLIVTLSIPVYNHDQFLGVMGADIQLARITEAIENINLGESNIPFLLDSSGTVLVMTDNGYDYFGLQRETVAFNESPRLNILDVQSEDLQAAAQQILFSQDSLTKITVNGIENYLAVATLESTGYKFVILVPVNEVNSEIILSRDRIQSEITSVERNITIILIGLLVVALMASLLIGQVITLPMKRLTETVEKITGGNLASRAVIETQDETGLLARSFNAMTDRLTDTLQGLEERIAERTSELVNISQSNARRAAQFESIAQISRIISSTQSLDALLPQITETISAQFGFYHTGIFLLDSYKEYAVLVAANSEGGKRMLARNHRLRVGETGIVGYVTHTGQPRVAMDVGQDAAYFNNPDLLDTHSEIALPLRSGSEIIGALDVQSTEHNAFTQEDVNILSALADQVSIAIQNARSFQQSREALEQAERAAAQLSEQQWKHFIKAQSISGYHFDGVEARRISSPIETKSKSLEIPLILRGTRVGTLRLSTPDPDRTWDENEIAMAQATADRTAFAIENARLLQEAQKRAAKERAIGQISAKIGNLINLDNIVQTTIKELGSTLPNTEVAIQFTSGQSES
jgi:GAF domain-containing protein/HAMP domain-containing protein